MPVHTRSRRTVLTVAAAAFVLVAPTACDYAVATTDPSVGSESGSHSGHYGHGSAPTASGVQTVPVGAIEELDPDAPGGTDPDETAADVTGAPSPSGEPSDEPAPDATDESAATPSSPTGSSTPGSSAPAPVAPPAAPPVAPGPEILGDDCTTSDLEPHDGFQDAPRCVAIAFGEVAAQDRSPSLLITGSPDTVAPGQPFTLEVSTRNLVRDRFLGAAAGGYYRESSFLNEQGIQRGHFHTACRLLPSLDEAPDAAPAPAFFLATQDNGGGPGADTVEVPVPGIEGSGELQCTVWAGDGSHRVPMMQRANQTPAFDAVRITVE